jgi:hypothetical protein
MEVRILILLLLVSSPCLWARDGWRMEVESAPWAWRLNHNVEAFNGKLWVFNGSYGTNPPPAALRGIWSSPNGRVWVKEGDELWGGAQSGSLAGL